MERLSSLQSILLVLYAVSLPLSITASWIILTCGLVVWLLLCLREPERVSRLRRAPLLLPTAAFAAAVCLSGFINGGPVEAGSSLLALRQLTVYFWAYSSFIIEPDLRLRCIQPLLLVGAVAGLWGAVQQLTGFHPFGYPYLQGTGFLAGPMAFAGQMQALGFLALGLLAGGGYTSLQFGFGRLALFLPVVVANLAGILFACERSAWLGALVGVLVLAVAMSWRQLARCVVILMVISALAWLTVPAVKTRLQPIMTGQEDVSIQVRLFLWQEATEICRDNPIAGVGIRRFPHFDIPEAIVPGRSIDINHAHSNYLHILATTGTIGFLSFIWIWLAALITAWRTYKAGFNAGLSTQRRFDAATALGILGGVVSLAVAGIFEYNFGTSQVKLLEWFVLALLAPVPRHQAEVGEKS